MNNEEKILEMLSQLTVTVNGMQSDIKELKNGQNEINERLDRLETKVDGIKEQVVEFEAKTVSIKPPFMQYG